MRHHAATSPVRIELVTANSEYSSSFTEESRTETSSLIAALVQLELDCGLSSRGIGGYEQLLRDPRSMVIIATSKVDRSGGEKRPEKSVVGCFSAMIVLDELQIDNVAVAAWWRGRGIASELVAAGLFHARQSGCRSAVLEVRTANLPARQLYLKSGFIEVGRRPGYYQHPTDDAIIMTADL
jgi:ribosomal protein S18 acetylase RimI-like enzyme